MVSTNFINECKNRANANRLGQIVVNGVDTPISQSNNLQSFEIDSGCYVDGNIIGSVYAKCLKANFIAGQNNLSDKSIQTQIGVKYADLSSEYINMGKYIVEHPNNEITTQYSQITAYDSLYTSLDSKYICNIDYSTGNKTLSDLYIDVCNQLGLIPVTTTFINSTIPITANPFTNGEKNRTVLQTIAKISCSFIDIDVDTDEIDLCWLSQNEEPDYIFYKNDYSSVEGGQVVCGPINCLIIKNSQVDDENVTIKDDESIEGNGEHSIIISEDYILHNAELRQQAINSIWNRVKGMKYVDCKLTTYYGKPFLKLGNRIRIYISDTEYFDTYVLKHNFTYDGSFTSVIESPALTKQEIKTKQDISLGQKLSNTQIDLNKQKKKITALVEETSEQNKKITQLSLSLDGIKGEISDIADITITSEGNGSITAENINESEPIFIKVHATSNENYSFLYPGENLYPGANTFTKSRTLLFKNSNGYSTSYEIPNDLLYLDENTYDEFVLDYEEQKCYIVHRVGINENNENYKLTAETTEYFDYPEITLQEGDYTISTPSGENTYIYVRLMTKNIYTSQFATQIEMNAKIEAKANKINLEVSQKVDNKDYTNAKITALINDGKSSVKIKADKIDLAGYVTVKSANSTYASKSGLSGGTTTINGGCITTGTIDASKVTVKNLNADNITSGTISVNRLDSKVITTDNFSAQTINANKITTGTIDASKVTVKNLNADNITSGTLTADKISGGTISASTINLGNGVCKITTSGQLTCSNIKATGGTIAGLTINEEAIFNGKGIGTAGSCGMSYNIDGWAFWAGNGAYRVTHEGKVICSNIEVSGGSINIQRGNYYFNMGLATSNPSCSGLNVGYYGIKANSNITATGFAITDSDTGKSYSIGIRDYNGHVHYLTFTGGILTAWEYV